MIYFRCPDFAKKSGGVKRLYHVTKILIDNGFDACILHGKLGFKLNWCGIDVPIRYTDEKIKVEKEDIIVVPEGNYNFMKIAGKTPAKKIIFAMSIEYIYTALMNGVHWQDTGFDKAIVTTDGLKEFVENTMDVPAVNIGFSIDHEKYKYNPEEKENIICYLGRPESNKREADSIFRILINLWDKFRYYHLIPLTNYSLDDYATIVRKAKYFLTFAPRWGCNSAVMEAQSAGCHIVGYQGVGNTIVDSECSCLTTYGDWYKVASMINFLEANTLVSENKIKSGIVNALKWDYEHEKNRVINYFDKELKREVKQD